MMRYQNLFLAVAVLALACATWLERPRTVSAQATYSQPVKVMNAGASQAVPVSGTVSVGGTVPVNGTVNVGNTVPVSGTVVVGNTNPIPVLPGLGGTPYDQTGYCSIQGGSNYCTISFTPPDPGEWVMESIGCSGSAASGDSVVAEFSYEDHYAQNNRTLDFPLQRAATQQVGSDFFANNLLLRAYTDRGRTKVSLSRYTASGPDTSATSVTFSCVVSGLKY